jgi:uncharacterized protein
MPPLQATAAAGLAHLGYPLQDGTAMKMHRENTARVHRITGYGAGYVAVDEQPLTRSFVVTPETLITDWAPAHVSEMDDAALEVLSALSPAIILLGSGAEQFFPPASLLAPMLTRGIGIEVMTTAAACRTYNILVAEGRAVAAGLFIP